MEVLGDTRLVVWPGTCGEDLGTCRWEIRKKRRVSGDDGEHRTHTKAASLH